MKKKKKVLLIVFVSILGYILIGIFIVITGIYGYKLLLNNGYIPFTEEYDCRVFMKLYKENKIDFELLMEEVAVMNCDIPEQYFESDYQVRYYCDDSEWEINVLTDDYKCVYTDSKPIENVECVEHIEEVFNESLFGVEYVKENDQYIFNIGEYYRIFIDEENVRVE